MKKTKKIQHHEMVDFLRGGKNKKKSSFSSESLLELKRYITKRNIIIAGMVLTVAVVVGVALVVNNIGKTVTIDAAVTISDANNSAVTDNTDGQKIAMFDKALLTAVTHDQKSSLYMNKSVVYMNLKQYDKALDCAKKADTETPDSSYILGRIAYIYKQLGDNKKALEYYDKAIDGMDASDYDQLDTLDRYKAATEELRGLK